MLVFACLHLPDSTNAIGAIGVHVPRRQSSALVALWGVCNYPSQGIHGLLLCAIGSMKSAHADKAGWDCEGGEIELTGDRSWSYVLTKTLIINSFPGAGPKDQLQIALNVQKIFFAFRCCETSALPTTAGGNPKDL